MNSQIFYDYISQLTLHDLDQDLDQTLRVFKRLTPESLAVALEPNSPCLPFQMSSPTTDK